jgi:hypothetical protein
MRPTSVRSWLSRSRRNRTAQPATYLIACDLHQEEDYSELRDAIDQVGEADWCLDNVWFVSSVASAAYIHEHLSYHLRDGDRIIVVLCGGAASWSGFGDDFSEWLNRHL